MIDLTIDFIDKLKNNLFSQFKDDNFSFGEIEIIVDTIANVIDLSYYDMKTAESLIRNIMILMNRYANVALKTKKSGVGLSDDFVKYWKEREKQYD